MVFEELLAPGIKVIKEERPRTDKF